MSSEIGRKSTTYVPTKKHEDGLDLTDTFRKMP